MAVDLRVLRTLLSPEISIVPGRAMMARVVVADGGGRGTLSIAGYLLEAELPQNVRAGEDLRLVVRQVSPERVLLGISQPHANAIAQPLDVPLPPPITVPLPGGGTVQVTERDPGAAGGSQRDSHALTLRYDAPSLGAVDLSFALDVGSLRLGVTVAPGALALAQAESDGLRQSLADELHRAISVMVAARREPLDVYA